MPKDPNRRVSFFPLCEVREFGHTDVESDSERPTTLESMTYAAKWIKAIPEFPVPVSEVSTAHDANASTVGLAGDSPCRMPIRTTKKLCRSRTKRVLNSCPSPQPIRRVKRFSSGTFAPSESPRRRPTLKSSTGCPTCLITPSRTLKRQPRMTHLAAEQVTESLPRKQDSAAGAEKINLQKNYGITWTKPIERVRMARSSGLESSGETSGETVSIQRKKKKLLTVKERMIRKIAQKKSMENREDTITRMNYLKFLEIFIENAKNNIYMPSIASTSIDATHINFRFSHFKKLRAIFVGESRRDPRKMDFEVRANINRRLANPNIDRNVRIFYEVIRNNYDSTLGPHFYYLFTYKKDKHFRDLEKALLLGN